MSHTALIFLSLMIPGTFFLGVYDVLTRKLLQKGIKEGFLLGITFISSGTLYLLGALFFGGVVIKQGFWSAFLVTVTLNTFAQFAWYKAFRYAEASLISPLRLITPPLVLISGFFVLREVPSLWGVMGVLTTIIGILFLFRSEAHFKQIKVSQVLKSPGVLYGIFGAVSFAVSFPFDKKAIASSSVLLFAGCAYFVIGGIHLIVVLMRNRGGPHLRDSFRSLRGTLPLSVAMHLAGGYLTFSALQFSLAAYAASAKRLWSLWAVLLSGHFLKEKNIGKKLLATLIMIAGIALTVFLG